LCFPGSGLPHKLEPARVPVPRLQVLHLWRGGEGRWWGRFKCLVCEYVWQGALNLRNIPRR